MDPKEDPAGDSKGSLEDWLEKADQAIHESLSNMKDPVGAEVRWRNARKSRKTSKTP